MLIPSFFNTGLYFRQIIQRKIGCQHIQRVSYQNYTARTINWFKGGGSSEQSHETLLIAVLRVAPFAVLCVSLQGTRHLSATTRFLIPLAKRKVFAKNPRESVLHIVQSRAWERVESSKMNFGRLWSELLFARPL